MSDWEEIKRLAADFQKIQLSSTSQKLSERNCIEIITWLKDKKLIDLIFTVDGKEFLTTNQLVQDIRNELYVNGGRINLVELAKIIGVDLTHITNHMKDVLKLQKDVHLILGQLIDSSYITKIAGEINEKLSQQGQINISDLTIAYDLPADFLQQIVEKYLGKLIHGKQDANDPQFFFTETFIARSKAKIRGALMGLTKPTYISLVLNHIAITEKLFFSLFDQISVPGSLTCRMVGAQYVPNIYAKSQNDWVNSFFRQNSYLEFDSLARLGISDCKTYVKKQFSDDAIFLNSCVISPRILSTLEADIEECISSKSYLDLQVNLPSVFNDKDLKIILDQVLTKHNQQQQIILINDTIIVSKAFMEQLSKLFDGIIEEKAKSTVDSGRYQEYQTDLQVSAGAHKSAKDAVEVDQRGDKREERRKKAAGGKAGGGMQGRETKTKSTKKSHRSHGNKFTEDDNSDSVSDKKQLIIVTKDDVGAILINHLDELEEHSDAFVDYFLPKLNDKAINRAAEIYATLVTDQTASMRQTHNQLQDKLNTLIANVRLFEKGQRLFPDEVQQQLAKYVLKTICTEIVSEVLNYAAAEQNKSVSTLNFNNDQRLKLVNEFPADLKTPLLPLVKSLAGSNLDDFMAAIDDGLTACGMIIKKVDKKKDRLTVLNHRHNLQDELNKCEDLALVLHLAILIIFTTATQAMLHISGRNIAAVLTFLKPYLKEEDYSELTSYYDFVTLMLSDGSEAENAREKLKEKVSNVKNIAIEFKKPSTERS